MNPRVKILSLIMDIGEMLLTAGAEVNRVEDTLKRIGKAYGFTRVDVFTIIYSIVVTVQDGEQDIYTQTRRVDFGQTDMWRIEQCNDLSRRICQKTMSIPELEKEVEIIRCDEEKDGRNMLLLNLIVAPCFTIFFGGGICEAIASAGVAFVFSYAQRFGNRLKLQTLIQNIFCAFIIGITALCLCNFGQGMLLDKIIIGNIMLLIPGIAFTSSLRDIISGNIISGLLGLCNAVMQAVALAVGIAVALFCMGGLMP